MKDICFFVEWQSHQKGQNDQIIWVGRRNITKIHSYLSFNHREKICNCIVCIPQKALNREPLGPTRQILATIVFNIDRKEAFLN